MTKGNLGQSIFSIVCALGITVALVGTTTSTGPVAATPTAQIA